MTASNMEKRKLNVVRKAAKLVAKQRAEAQRSISPQFSFSAVRPAGRCEPDMLQSCSNVGARYGAIGLEAGDMGCGKMPA